MSILTVSGRPVKKIGVNKKIGVKRPGKLIGAPTPQILRALRRAKCPAPWAGWGCTLTEAGLAADTDAPACGCGDPAAPGSSLCLTCLEVAGANGFDTALWRRGAGQ